MPIPPSAGHSAFCPDRRRGSRFLTAPRPRRFQRWSGRRTSCKFSPRPNRNGASPRPRRSASLATASRASRELLNFQILPANRVRAIYKQLNDYRTGSRTHPLMTDIAKALDEATLADIAAYYAAQPKRNADPATLAESPPAIVRLVELGDPSRNIPPCASCHRPGSGGPIETPILSEQGKEYLVLQLKMYAAGDRRNDVYGRMRAIAAKLTPTEIDGLAVYYRAGFR